MTLIIGANIGTSGALETASAADRIETIELTNGVKRMRHPREVVTSLSREYKFVEAWGIEGNSDQGTTFGTNGVVFDSVTHTMTEVVGDRRMKPASGLIVNGAFVPPDGSAVLQYTDDMIWFGYEESLNMTIKFVTGSEFASSLTTKGNRLTTGFVINPAVSTIAAPTPQNVEATTARVYGPYIVAEAATTPDFSQHWLVSNVSKTQSAADWHTCQVELTRFIGVGASETGSSPLLKFLQLWATNKVLSPLEEGYMDQTFPAYYQITITRNMSSTANPTLTEAMEIYPDAEVSTGYTPPA